MKYLFSVLLAIALDANGIERLPSSVSDTDVEGPVKTLIILPGTLRENAENLLHMFGWKLYRWDAANFYIDAEYKIDIANLEQGLDFLLDPYPLQAQLIKVNKTVLFVNKTKVQRE